MVVTAFYADWVMRVVFGLIALVCFWIPTHINVRDKLVRHVLLAIAILSLLILIHLPHVPGVVQYDSSQGPPANQPIVVNIDLCKGPANVSALCPDRRIPSGNPAPRILWPTIEPERHYAAVGGTD